MQENNLKKKALSSATIKLIEKLLTTGLQLVISIVLARILSPDDYGTIALINVFISLSNVFVESGLGVGLVQKKDLSQKDINTVFISGIVISIVIYGTIFLISPFVGAFYSNDIIPNVLRVYALSVILGSMTSVPNSLASRNLQYQKQLIPAVIAVVISGSVGVLLACKGYGVWALVYQQIIQRIVYLMVISILIKYKPKLEFSYESFKVIFGFTWKIVVARLISAFFNEVRNLIIGKKYSSSQLGYYNKGHQFPATIATSTDYSLQSVMFSVYSKEQDNVEKLKSMVRRTMKLSSYVLFPMMFGLIAISKPLVIVVLTEKWLPAVPFMRIACLAYALQPINTANGQAINALGRSDVSLKLELIKRIIAICLIVGAVFISVEAIAWTLVLVAVVGNVTYFFANVKLLNYGIKEQIKDLLPAFLLSFVVCIISYSISFIQLDNKIILVLQILTGVVVYITGSYLFKIDSYEYCINMLRDMKK